MVHIAQTMEVLARRPIFEVSFSDYVGTINGLFNFLEVCGGIAVFLMVDRAESSSQRCLKGSSFTFWFNGFMMLVSSILSATSSYYLPVLFYYVIFHGTAGVLYIFTSISLVRESHEVELCAMAGLMTGGMHAFHCSYVTYKLYYEK
ncbi:uncharacterized protein [Dermacentor andersoni]|uniref:uncharacterized protein n=1 Tax=Dermacentor andersoni TaxID=34620 RepID=UPI002417E1F9|nr:uncharacterized protein LOC129385387 [Dermacentor andersoni]